MAEQTEPRAYAAIDLKSFYASVECHERNLNPLETNLVVADVSRTEKTICLAVSPSLKAYGIPGRPRLFEVVQRTEQVNRERLQERRAEDLQRDRMIKRSLRLILNINWSISWLCREWRCI